MLPPGRGPQDRRIREPTRKTNQHATISAKMTFSRGTSRPGVFVVRRDDSKRRNMTRHAIVRALRKLEESAAPIADTYDELNHWQ